MNWADAMKALFEFLRAPTGLGFLSFLLIILLLMYTAPIAAMTWVNTENTNRIVAALVELRTAIRSAQIANARN